MGHHIQTLPTTPLGWSIPGSRPVEPGRQAVVDALRELATPFAVVSLDGDIGVCREGQVLLGATTAPRGALPLLAWVPALTPDQLGDPSFRSHYGVRANYVAGAMANGIASEELVIAMANAGLLAFFGAAGLPTKRITAAIDRIQAAVGDRPYGFNLIHSPHEPWQEQETVELYLARGVRNVSAAAYLGLTPQVVQLRVSGIHTAPDGSIVVPNRIVAKISREEVAEKFLRPAPEKMLRALVEKGAITEHEAKLAAHVPMADDLSAEADSGGHTDNRPMPVLLPLILALRDRVCAEEGYARPVRVGVGGGICTPASTAAAFALGAAYVLTGTVNQACVESGTSPMVKAMLADAGAADVGMAPASDMFEAGVEVQVLKRGTLFAMRGAQLYELYRRHASLDEIDADTLAKLEKSVFRKPVAEVWAGCEQFFAERDPTQLDRAATDPKHKMALVFRWYLGLSSHWAIGGDESRKLDTQIWCGPGIGAFNAWTRGTFLADPAERRVVTVAANMLAGAAAITRSNALLNQGVDAGPESRTWRPRPLDPGLPR
ncbi:MAG: PfaD family polyunsaturated fatty acid/polyketide biosynthesis protein [Alphaproteobacteria bacterium]|nr:PfaD family polyunsaturated fatty acid/polyketide biosynthesis protein [Alphaproteobacteria bacterium]